MFCRLKCKKVKLQINWDNDNCRCSIYTKYSRATLVYKPDGYEITQLQVNSNVLFEGKGKELMEIIIQESINRNAKFLYVVPHFEECLDEKSLCEALSIDDPQAYIENWYKKFGFVDYKPCNDGSSHHIYRKKLK